MRRKGPLAIGVLCLAALLASPLLESAWNGSPRPGEDLQAPRIGRGDNPPRPLPPNPPAQPGPGVPYRPQPPEIYLTGATAESRGAEAGLAKFILALQAREWKDAADCLASSVPTRERSLLRQGRWLVPRAAHDLVSVFYMPRIRLRTTDLSPIQARVQIRPEPGGSSHGAVQGITRVTMVREGSRWQVLLRLSDTAQ